jgi:outer membrane lipoprotein-sorting protein
LPQLPRALQATYSAALLLGVALLASCTPDIPPPKNALTDPAELRAAMERRLDSLQSARFKDVVLDYYGKDERIKLRQLLLVQRPASLRVQTRLPGSDEIVSLLVSDGKTFSMHRRDTNQYYTGAPSRSSINLLLPVDLSGEDVVRVMLGGAPWDRIGADNHTLSWDRERGQYKLCAPNNSHTLCLWVRHNDWAMVELEERDKKGERVYHYIGKDWERVGAVSLPTWHQFVWPAKHLDFSLDVGETQVNVELSEALFTLEPPPSSQIIEVDSADVSQ